MKPPRVAAEPIPGLTDTGIVRLLKACEGNSFIDRHDMAIVRLFIGTGMRRAELAGLKLSDVT